MPKIYVASGLANHLQVIRMQEVLVRHGWTISFDWAEAHRQELASGKKLTPEEKRELANNMIQGVRDAHAFLLVCPGKRGAHVELGIAIAAGDKPIVVLSTDPEQDISFYHAGDMIALVRQDTDAVFALDEAMRYVKQKRVA